MLIKTITYTDYNGNERTEDFCFNLNEVEVMDMTLTSDGDLKAAMQKIAVEKDKGELVRVFKELLNKSYGVKSDDGRRFMKNPEILANFIETPAYPKLFMELATQDNAAAEFINEIMPKGL